VSAPGARASRLGRHASTSHRLGPARVRGARASTFPAARAHQASPSGPGRRGETSFLRQEAGSNATIAARDSLLLAVPERGGGPTESSTVWDPGGGWPLGGTLDHLVIPNQTPLLGCSRGPVPPEAVCPSKPFSSSSLRREVNRRAPRGAFGAPRSRPRVGRRSSHGWDGPARGRRRSSDLPARDG
jgi:hypothetical protein